MRNFDQMLKQAQQLQEKMQEMQEKISEVEVTGTAGGGMVTVTLTGKHEVRALKIEKSLLDPNEGEVLEDLIVAAFNDARAKLEAQTAAEMGKLTQGLPPGMKFPF